MRATELCFDVATKENGEYSEGKSCQRAQLLLSEV